MFRRIEFRTLTGAPCGLQPVLDDVPFDVVNIDGRFRTACALNALRHISERRREHARIIFHNFHPPYRQYSQYGAVLEFAEVVENATKYAVLRKRAGVDERRLDAALRRAAFDYH